MKSPSAALLDAGAVALSSLCLLHCLALPLLAAALPLFGTWAEAEWVHLLFVAIALPLTGYALWRAERRHPLPVLAWATAGAGLGLLLAGNCMSFGRNLQLPASGRHYPCYLP